MVVRLQDPEKKPDRTAKTIIPPKVLTANRESRTTVYRILETISVLNTPHLETRRLGRVRPGIEAALRIAS